MFSSLWNLALTVALIALGQPQACSTQYFLPENEPYTGSLSRASSVASQRQLQFGGLGLSHGIADSRSVTTNNGGFRNGGTTSIADSTSRTGQLNLGGLDIGSTLTASKTRTNDAVAGGLSHDLNVGGLGIGTSLSRENLDNGFGLQRSRNGGLRFGLGLLNLDLTSNRHPTNSQTLTQAQAKAQGEDAFAKSNSDAHVSTRNFGVLDLTNTQSQSKAISGSRFGKSSAQAGGLAGGQLNSFGYFRTRRSTGRTNLGAYVRAKRQADFIPFTYSAGESVITFGSAKASFLRKRNANAQGLASGESDSFEQQAGANAQSYGESNGNGFFQSNGASSIGSNLATDGTSGQVSSANVNQENSFTDDGSQSSNNAQSQALNFEEDQQQAVNANAGTTQVETENGQRTVAQGGSQVTENNEYGTISNIANTNSQVYEEGDTSGSQADANSQSIFQGADGQNSAVQTNANVNSIQGPDGFVSNSASSQASAVSQGGRNGVNVVASASASSSAGFDGDNSGFGDASSNAGAFNDFFGSDGAQANSGAFGNFNGAQGFANGRSESRAFKIRKRKTFSFNTQLRPQQQQRQQERRQNRTPPSFATLEIINDSKEINWPKNRIQLYNHYPQQQKQPQLPLQREQHRPQQKHPQQLHHYSSINPNSSTEQFAVIDENERHGRTFTFITDLINSLTQETCIYPCTLEAYHRNRCCETALVVPQPPLNVCCTPPWPSTILQSPTTFVRPPAVLPPSSLKPSPAFPLIPTQCCIFCPAFGLFGPPPCIRYTFPGTDFERLPLIAG